MFRAFSTKVYRRFTTATNHGITWEALDRAYTKPAGVYTAFAKVSALAVTVNQFLTYLQIDALDTKINAKLDKFIDAKNK
jgi:hypothetical protein